MLHKLNYKSYFYIFDADVLIIVIFKVFPLKLTTLSQTVSMINKLVQTVYEHIMNKNKLLPKTLLKRSRYLGLPVKDQFTKERIVFIISQYILTLIDKNVQQKNQNKKRLKKNQMVFGFSNIQRINSQSDKQDKQKTSGFLELALVVYRTFCCSGQNQSDEDITTIFNFEKQIQDNQQQITLQIIQLRQNIQFVNDFKDVFKCHCNQIKPNFTRCQNCLLIYHPECQSQKLMCNKCFVKYYMVPLQNKLTSPFGGNKNIQTYFCGYLQTQRHQQFKRPKFHQIRFDLQDLIDIKNSNDSQIILKIKNCKIMEPVVNQKIANKKKRTKMPKDKKNMFTLNDTNFELFLNFYRIKSGQILFQNKNCVILKINYIYPRTFNNILIVKTQAQLGVQESHKYIIGIYKITKLKPKVESNFSLKNQITQGQSLILKKLIQQKQVNPHALDKQFVRSYGCDHYQKFSLVQLKEQIKAKMIIINYGKQNAIQNNQPSSRITRRKRLAKKNTFLQCPICQKHLFVLHYDLHTKLPDLNGIQQQIMYKQNQPINLIQGQSSYTSEVHISHYQSSQIDQELKQIECIDLSSFSNQQNKNQQNSPSIIQIDSQQ